MSDNRALPAVIKIKDRKNGAVAILATGEYSCIGNSWNLSFSYDNAQFTIGLSEGTVTVSRIGEESYTLFLEKGKTHPMIMSTPFGNIEYSVTPKSIKVNSLPNGIEASFRYDISPSNDGKPVSMYISCETDEN